MTKVFPIFIFLLLGGCALPLPLQIASWVVDGASYIATDKSITDHGISMVMNRDCSLLRIISRGEICSDEDYIGFAAIFRDSNGVRVAAPVAATAPATNNNITEVASNDDADVIPAGFVSASGPPDSETGSATACVAKLDVNVRAEPKGVADIKKVLLRSESVKCFGEKDGWRMVEFATSADGDAKYGWIDGAYLELYQGPLFL